MSIGKKLLEQTAGLAASLDKIREAPAVPGNKSAPAQLMAFRGEMEAYESRIADLEKRLASGSQTEIRLTSIEPNPWQPRRVFDSEGIKALAKSISETGLIQPVIVRSVPSRDTFQLIAGERRCRAHQYLGLETVKAIVIEASDAELAVMALAENIDREDLTDFEIGKAIRRVENEFPSKKKLAEAIGVGRQDLYKYFAFEKLPSSIQADLEVNPALLGRNAADRMVAVLTAQGDQAVDQLDKLWQKMLAKELEQGRAVQLLEQAFSENAESKPASTKSQTITVGERSIGSIVKSKSQTTIKIDNDRLSPEMEVGLIEFIKKLFT